MSSTGLGIVRGLHPAQSASGPGMGLSEGEAAELVIHISDLQGVPHARIKLSDAAHEMALHEGREVILGLSGEGVLLRSKGVEGNLDGVGIHHLGHLGRRRPTGAQSSISQHEGLSLAGPVVEA